MKLTLENIGKVKHAEIDLSKDLIVLCGPNNTGKTYVAYSVYGLFKLREDSLIVSPGPFVNLNKTGVFPDESEIDLEDAFLKNSDWLTEFLSLRFREELPLIFASPIDSFGEARLQVDFDAKRVLERIKEIEKSKVFRFHGELIFQKASGSFHVDVIYSPENGAVDAKLGVIEVLANRFVKDIFLIGILEEVRIEPAERIAINLFSREISERRSRLFEEMVEHKAEEEEPIEVVPDQIGRYSSPIRDSLRTAEQLDQIQKYTSPLSFLATEMEHSILGGKVFVSDHGEVRFLPQGSHASIGIHLTGSVVKSLASIVFYLRHIAKPNDFYIIDEPELTLHPDNQRKMARIVARMVNAGIKVMMSTHSDYIIRELNNLMMLKVDGQEETVKKLMEDYGYKQEELLDFKRVGAYMFTDNVAPLEVNETGFEVSTIDDEIHSLNNSSAAIYFKLHD